MKKISISKINELRKKTGIGIIDCKNALEISNGDINKAVFFLRKKFKNISLKRSNFHLKEGAILSSLNLDYSMGTIVGISCETDFLSRSLDFLKFLRTISKQSLLYHGYDKKEFLNFSCKQYGYQCIQEMIDYYMGVFREKIELKIFEKICSPFTIQYTHNYKIATLVGFSSSLDLNIAKDIAMHVTAMDPISIEDLPETFLKEEMEIMKNQIEYKNKSEQVIKRILDGKKQKLVEEHSLLHQKFIKNHKFSVKDYLHTHNNHVNILFFRRRTIQ
ncbi:translation elongation factor Ts [Blattabacterium cuenoti]|uniref:translation elongation factor Ts n=1 Tax=Blattabacterium cuenoti TaxID=1653831 RepID=UPI00163C9BB5|nr:translation elongation factor Ts [Blattabacterium cuenoti]